MSRTSKVIMSRRLAIFLLVAIFAVGGSATASAAAFVTFETNVTFAVDCFIDGQLVGTIAVNDYTLGIECKEGRVSLTARGKHHQQDGSIKTFTWGPRVLKLSNNESFDWEIKIENSNEGAGELR